MRPYKAAINPPGLEQVLPAASHGAGKAEQRLGRDHQRVKGRYRSIRGFKMLHSAQTVCAGQEFVRNLRKGVYGLGKIMANPRTPQASRLMLAERRSPRRCRWPNQR
jgi:transposase-like protein